MRFNLDILSIWKVYRKNIWGQTRKEKTPASRLSDGRRISCHTRMGNFPYPFLKYSRLGPIFGAIAGAMFGLPPFYGL